MTTVKEIVRKRILEDMLRESRKKSADGWLVLVMDPRATRIISSCCRMYDITTEGVTLVENLNIARQSLPSMDAVYFITPTLESVNAMCADFDKKPDKPHYANVHVFFTSQVPPSCMERIKKSRIVNHIQTFQETSIDFLVPESQTVHFDMPKSLDIFSPSSNESDSLQVQTVNGLVNFLATLGEVPLIRYDASSVLSRDIAFKVNGDIDKLAKDKPTLFKPTATPSTLVIVDRSHDPMCGLLHEFTYQAMVHDVLDVENDVFVSHANGKTKKIMLTEDLKLWPELRHEHISEVINRMLDEFNHFIKANKLVNLNDANSLSEMSAAIKDMPKYRESVEKYEIHMDIPGQCMQMYDSGKLERVAGLEQDMATGTDAQGNEAKAIYPRLVAILNDPASSKQLKIRILLIYLIYTKGIDPEERDSLFKLADIDNNDQTAFLNMYHLGVALQKSTSKGKSLMSFVRNLGGKRKRPNEPDFDLSRFRPALTQLLQDALAEKLSTSSHPFVRKNGAVETASSSGAAATGVSMRTKARGVIPTWQNKKQKAPVEQKASTGPRMIVFVVGCMTYSEMRVAYQLGAENDRQIIIGSNCIMTPDQYVEALSKMPRPSTDF